MTEPVAYYNENDPQMCDWLVSIEGKEVKLSDFDGADKMFQLAEKRTDHLKHELANSHKTVREVLIEAYLQGTVDGGMTARHINKTKFQTGCALQALASAKACLEAIQHSEEVKGGETFALLTSTKALDYIKKMEENGSIPIVGPPGPADPPQKPKEAQG